MGGPGEVGLPGGREQGAGVLGDRLQHPVPPDPVVGGGHDQGLLDERPEAGRTRLRGSSPDRSATASTSSSVKPPEKTDSRRRGSAPARRADRGSSRAPHAWCAAGPGGHGRRPRRRRRRAGRAGCAAPAAGRARRPAPGRGGCRRVGCRSRRPPPRRPGEVEVRHQPAGPVQEEGSAGDSPTARASASAGGRGSGGTANSVSPRTRSAALLEASTVSPGQASTSRATSLAAGSRCSTLSRTSSTVDVPMLSTTTARASPGSAGPDATQSAMVGSTRVGSTRVPARRRRRRPGRPRRRPPWRRWSAGSSRPRRAR